MVRDEWSLEYESKIDTLNSFVNELKRFVVEESTTMEDIITKKNNDEKILDEEPRRYYNLPKNDEFDVLPKTDSLLKRKFI